MVAVATTTGCGDEREDREQAERPTHTGWPALRSQKRNGAIHAWAEGMGRLEIVPVRQERGCIMGYVSANDFQRQPCFAGVCRIVFLARHATRTPRTPTRAASSGLPPLLPLRFCCSSGSIEEERELLRERRCMRDDETVG